MTESQYDIHEPNGGIRPDLALNAHRDVLPKLIKKSLDESKLKSTEIDIIAATRGPGLTSSLYVGYNAGKILAATLK